MVLLDVMALEAKLQEESNMSSSEAGRTVMNSTGLLSVTVMSGSGSSSIFIFFGDPKSKGKTL